MGILLAIIAALCWGGADFLVRYATRMIGTYRTLLFMQVVGAVGLSVYMLASGQLARLSSGSHPITWETWLWAAATALLNAASALALYRAFQVGVLSVVSPIAASSSALTVVLSYLSGEKLSQARILGISATLIGVVLAATHFAAARTFQDGKAVEVEAGDKSGKGSKRGLTRGVGWALLSAVGYGVNFWMLGFQVSPILGGITPIWIIRLGTMVTLTLFALPTRQSIRIPAARAWLLLLPIGILDTAAYVTANFGLISDQVAVVSVLISLFSAVTVLLAWIFLRERLQWSQWLGVGIIFIGVALVNV